MRIGTVDTLRKIDSHCINELGIPSIVLMENAALKVVSRLKTDIYEKYTVICGRGNNGGDGFAIARHLIALKKNIKVFLIGEGALSADCRINYEILNRMGIKIETILSLEDVLKLKNSIESSEVVVDAIFGTGLQRILREPFLSAIRAINERGKFIISVDVPSGMEGDNGEILGDCVRAHETISFELYKRGFLNYNAQKYIGKVYVESIGVPEAVIVHHHMSEYITERNEMSSLIPKREVFCHKGNAGRVLVIAGSKGFTGAAYIAAEAAVKTGAGLVTLACDRSVEGILASKLTEAMTFGYEHKEELLNLMSMANAIAIGPGLGNSQKSLEVVRFVLSNALAPVIVDADGLNVLKDNLQLLKEAKTPLVITPHPGEMARLTGYSVDHINRNRLDISKSFAKENSVTVLLKGYNTVISDGNDIFINPTGTSSMATGGMGDCLTGIISSLVAQGLEPIRAAQLGAYVHGFAGDLLSQELHSVTACDVMEALPRILKQI